MKTLFFSLFFGCALSSGQAQRLVVVNGGLFGSSGTELGIYNPANGQYQSLDALGTTSAQDAYIEANRYLYLAAGDSLFKYDLSNNTRLASNAFGGWSAVKLAVHDDWLLAGNWYGMSEGNLRFFDKNTLAFVDSIPQIVRGATDIAVVGDYAYVAQNLNDASTGYMDSLGYLSVVHLPTRTWLRNDTLAQQGEDLGRLWYPGGDTLYAFNSVSNTVSAYSLSGQGGTTRSAGVNLQLSYYGNTLFAHNQTLYLPFDGAISGYDPVNGTALPQSAAVALGNCEGFAWAMDTLTPRFYLSRVFFSNQSANTGTVYAANGDSLTNFPVGYSPEVLCVWYDNLLASTSAFETLSLSLYPNPCADWLRLSSAEPEQPLELYLYDASGRLLRTVSGFLPGSQTLDLSDLQPGWYGLQVQGQNAGNQTLLFVKS